MRKWRSRLFVFLVEPRQSDNAIKRLVVEEKLHRKTGERGCDVLVVLDVSIHNSLVK